MKCLLLTACVIASWAMTTSLCPQWMWQSPLKIQYCQEKRGEKRRERGEKKRDEERRREKEEEEKRSDEERKGENR